MKVNESVFRELRLPLLSYATSLVNNVQDAQDVVQEVFVECLAGKRDAKRAYLFRAVRNRCFNRVRAYQRLQNALQRWQVILLQLMGEEDSRLESLDQVFSALPAKQREVLLLRVKSELKISEIAEVLTIPEGTVKSRINSAMARMRKQMEVSGGSNQ